MKLLLHFLKALGILALLVALAAIMDALHLIP